MSKKASKAEKEAMANSVMASRVATREARALGIPEGACVEHIMRVRKINKTRKTAPDTAAQVEALLRGTEHEGQAGNDTFATLRGLLDGTEVAL